LSLELLLTIRQANQHFGGKVEEFLIAFSLSFFTADGLMMKKEKSTSSGGIESPTFFFWMGVGI
jgi:hypothetical protein